MKASTQTKTVNNGVDVNALLGARELIEANPEAGYFVWRAQCSWFDGVHSHSLVKGFYGFGEEQDRKTGHMIKADHPEQFAATDLGPTPAEIALSALASCLTAGVVSVAQHRDIALRKVEAHVEGEMDIAGILGANADARNGFDVIRITFDIDADASQDQIAALVAQSQKRSAVFDMITNPTNTRVAIA